MNRYVLGACVWLLAWPLLAEQREPRVISAGASLTAILQALELAPQLVGVDSTSLPLLGDQPLPNIGYPRQVSAEGLLSLTPDVVVGSEEMGPHAVLTQLREAGIEVLILSAEPSLDALLNNITLLGQRFDRQEHADRLRSHLQQQIADLPAAPAARPQALFLLNHSAGSMLVAGGGTAGDSLIELGGMHNPLAGQFSQYRALSAEAFIGLAPVWLLTTTQSLQMAGGTEGLLALQPALRSTPAGQSGQVLGVDGSQMVGGFSPAITDTLLHLRQAAMRSEPPRHAQVD